MEGEKPVSHPPRLNRSISPWWAGTCSHREREPLCSISSHCRKLHSKGEERDPQQGLRSNVLREMLCFSPCLWSGFYANRHQANSLLLFTEWSIFWHLKWPADCFSSLVGFLSAVLLLSCWFSGSCSISGELFLIFFSTSCWGSDPQHQEHRTNGHTGVRDTAAWHVTLASWKKICVFLEKFYV